MSDDDTPKTMAEIMDEDDFKGEDKAYPFGTKYHWYEYNGQPVHQADERSFPQILRSKAKGFEYFGMAEVLAGNATPISEEEFNRLVAGVK